MRTTVDIPDDLVERLKKIAIQERTSVSEIVLEAVRSRVGRPMSHGTGFRLRDGSVHGDGLCDGVNLADPDSFSDAAYGDRG